MKSKVNLTTDFAKLAEKLAEKKKSKKEKLVNWWYHSKGLFYRIKPKRLGYVNSIRDMQWKFENVTNAMWQYHCQLTFSDEALARYYNAKICDKCRRSKKTKKYSANPRKNKVCWYCYGDRWAKVCLKCWTIQESWRRKCVSCKDVLRKQEREKEKKSPISYVVNKMSKIIRKKVVVPLGIKIFWKWEEGRKNSRPHYHMVVDFRNRMVIEKVYVCKDCELISEMSVRVTDRLKKSGAKLLCRNCGGLLVKEKKKRSWVDSDNNWKKKVYPHNWNNEKFNWEKWFESKRTKWYNKRKVGYDENKKPIFEINTDEEILVREYIQKRWTFGSLREKKGLKMYYKGKKLEYKKKYFSMGTILLRKIRSEFDLKSYVKKDYSKFGNRSLWLTKKFKKWGHSENLEFKENVEMEKGMSLIPVEQVLEKMGRIKVSEALRRYQEDQDNKERYVGYYDDSGEWLYDNDMAELEEMLDEDG